MNLMITSTRSTCSTENVISYFQPGVGEILVFPNVGIRHFCYHSACCHQLTEQESSSPDFWPRIPSTMRVNYYTYLFRTQGILVQEARFFQTVGPIWGFRAPKEVFIHMKLENADKTRRGRYKIPITFAIYPEKHIANEICPLIKRLFSQSIANFRRASIGSW